MIVGFDHPYFWYAATALGVLLAIYFWRKNSPAKVVPALFLWDPATTLDAAGRRWRWCKLPWSFFLEALILCALVTAAASPYWFDQKQLPPLVVILDNSWSMQAVAEDGGSPREIALASLEELQRNHKGRRILWVLAGENVRVAADGVEPVSIANFWRADSASADLAGALSFSRGRLAEAEIRVFTDHRPDFPLADEVGWFAAGVPAANLALVNARRRGDTVLLEVVNHSGSEQDARLSTVPGGDASRMTLMPGERRKIVFKLPLALAADPVTVRLEGEHDSLALDNQVILLPENPPPLRFAWSGSLPDEARAELGAAVERNPIYRLSADPELWFGGVSLPQGKFHRFFFHSGNREAAVIGTDGVSQLADHELTRGVVSDDLRWPMDPAISLPGEVVIRCGNQPLLTYELRLDGYYDFHLNAVPGVGNLTRRPFWPVLFWNLAEFLRNHRPGPDHQNWRLGETVGVVLKDAAATAVTAVLPDGRRERFPVVRQRAYLPDLPVGITRIADEAGNEFPVSVNALDGRESDLRSAGRFQREPLHSAAVHGATRPLSWLALAIALAGLLLHQFQLGERRKNL